MQSYRLMLDVNAVGTAPAARVAATVFAPDRLDPPPRAVVYASPGGGYARGYYDLQLPGHRGYSQAEYHTQRGLLFIAYDHPGTGDSPAPGSDALGLDVLAAIDAAVVRQLQERLEQGRLHPRLPALHGLRRIGMGQSMGGGLTILMQAAHAPFDAIAVLGYSALQTIVPQPGDAPRRALPDPADFSLEAAFGRIVDWVWPFHWEDVPADIVRRDVAGGLPNRTTAPPWGSLATPLAAAMLVMPRAVGTPAASIRVPVFVGVGARDVCPDPWLEPSAYSGSGDVTLAVVPTMAHMHNFASTREQLWCRLQHWIDGPATAG